jgi:acetyl esterase
MTGARSELAPGMAAFIERCDELFPPHFLNFDLAGQRACYDALCAAFRTPRPPGVSVEEDHVIVDGFTVRLRIYRPSGAEPRPCIVYYHGGGWIFGGLDSHDSVTADLAAKASATVIAVDYGLAPEHPFPAPVAHCYGALRHVAANADRLRIDPARLAVAGDSAGATFAVVMALRARDEGGPSLAAQLLIYPSIGLGLTEKGRADRHGAPLLSQEEMRYYATAYLGGRADTDEPYAAPVLAESFGGLPPAYILAVDPDPLVEDARLYARRLGEDGVAADLRVVEGLVHGCLRARAVCPAAAAAFDDFCAAARAML